MLPYTAIDWSKKYGYDRFKFELPKSGRPVRVVLEAWRADGRKFAGRKLVCEGTPTEDCDHPPFVNSTALEMHQRTKKHGPYANAIGQAGTA